MTASAGPLPARVPFGLVGYGFGGEYFHAPLLATAAEIEFVGVVTTSPQRRDRLAQNWPGTATFASLEAIAAAGAKAVAISTPVATHMPLAQAAMRLGLAVVSDKPFSLDLAEARVTIELSEQLGVPFAIYQNRRWDADFRTVKKLLAEGVLGDVIRFESHFERFEYDAMPAKSGGPISYDFGSHMADQALHLFGPAASVYAEAREHPAETFMDTDSFIAIRHAGGVVSHLHGSLQQGVPRGRFRVSGTLGAYVVDKTMEGQEFALIAGKNPATEQDRWGSEPVADWGRIGTGDASVVRPTERGRWDLYYSLFAKAVLGQGPVPVDPWESYAALRVLEAAHVSATEHRIVAIG